MAKVPYEFVDTRIAPSAWKLVFAGPWFVKPARLGASYGITRVTEDAELGRAVEAAAQQDHLVLIE